MNPKSQSKHFLKFILYRSSFLRAYLNLVPYSFESSFWGYLPVFIRTSAPIGISSPKKFTLLLPSHPHYSVYSPIHQTFKTWQQVWEQVWGQPFALTIFSLFCFNALTNSILSILPFIPHFFENPTKPPWYRHHPYTFPPLYPRSNLRFSS